jgi:hypothetical protein
LAGPYTVCIVYDHGSHHGSHWPVSQLGTTKEIRMLKYILSTFVMLMLMFAGFGLMILFGVVFPVASPGLFFYGVVCIISAFISGAVFSQL